VIDTVRAPVKEVMKVLMVLVVLSGQLTTIHYLEMNIGLGIWL